MSVAMFQGGGEMGARMRAMDWSRTPLGPVEGWPLALRTCVRIMLSSRQPMWLAWGDDLTYLYNDAYLSIIGGKHPRALGQPTSVVWQEIWSDIGPRIDSAMGGVEGTYDEALLLIMERHGYQEETYYTFSYSPIPDDDGRVRGIFCANTANTRGIIGERQVRLLGELAAGVGAVRTVADACALSARGLGTNLHDLPFALIYLVESEQRRVVLAGRSGMAKGHPAAPAAADLDAAAAWPFAEVLRTNGACAISDLDRRFSDLPAGAWERPPKQAVALPIAPSGETGRAGILVAGLNPFRLFDEDYQRFMGLICGQLAASIANAQAYEEERRRAEALAELDRAKTTFFSNVSHELRTPLTLLLGPLEETLAGAGSSGALPPPVRDHLELAHRNALRLLRLVNTLLDFSRLEAGRVQATYEAVDLPALTAEIASTFRSAVERAGLRLVVDTPPLDLPGTVVVHADRDMWEKVVLNLLSNALKFTFTGEIVVSLRSATGGRAVELSVRDTGEGIPAEELPRVFERFHRVQGARARTHEGTGIGLALVQELARLHGGTVGVESRVGVGTTFTVSIPTGTGHLPEHRVGAPHAAPSNRAGPAPHLEEAFSWFPDSLDPDPPLPRDGAAPPGAAVNGVEVNRSAVGGGARPRVLLADDNADMRSYLQRLLVSRYTVEAVEDGEAALASARAAPPDLVLTDVMMPRLDGFGLLAALRDDPRTREIPVVLLSARAGEESKVDGLEAGADDYLVKPFTARELLARVATHLDLARIRTEATRRERAAHEEAEAERRRLHDLFMQAPAFVCILRGPEHRLELINPPFRAIYGNRPFPVGQTARELWPDLADSGLFEALDRVYATGQPFTANEFYARIDRDADGELEDGYFNFIYQASRDAVGNIDGILVCGFEVTDQVKGRQQAEEAVRARDEFLSIASHELKTPVAGVKGLAQLLHRRHARGDLDAEWLARALSSLNTTADRLAELTHDLLDVSRVRTGQLPLSLEQVDLRELARDAVAHASERLDSAHRLLVDTREATEPVMADRGRIEQVLVNLLDNAVKYSPEGGETHVAVQGADCGVLVSVRDQGIGLPAAAREAIFEPFGRAANAMRANLPGMGLGLYICRQIVERHGGLIWAESAGEGRGTTMKVCLPVSPVPGSPHEHVPLDDDGGSAQQEWPSTGSGGRGEPLGG